MIFFVFFFFFKQKTAYEMRISDWSSDVCSSDLLGFCGQRIQQCRRMAAIDSQLDIGQSFREQGHHFGDEPLHRFDVGRMPEPAQERNVGAGSETRNSIRHFSNPRTTSDLGGTEVV